MPLQQTKSFFLLLKLVLVFLTFSASADTPSIQVVQNRKATAVLNPATGQVVVEGDYTHGGSFPDDRDAILKTKDWWVSYLDSKDGLNEEVVQVVATNRAFAGLKKDGSIISWGHIEDGGFFPSSLKEKITAKNPAIKLVGTKILRYEQDVYDHNDTQRGAFGALLKDGQVVTWGSYRHGGADSYEYAVNLREKMGHVGSLNLPKSYLRPSIDDALDIQATQNTFAVLTKEGVVKSWGECASSSDFVEASNLLSFEHHFVAHLKSGGSQVFGCAPNEGFHGYYFRKKIITLKYSSRMMMALTDRGELIAVSNHEKRPIDLKGLDSIPAIAELHVASMVYNSFIGRTRGGELLRLSFQSGQNPIKRKLLENVQFLSTSRFSFVAVVNSPGEGGIYFGNYSKKFTLMRLPLSEDLANEVIKVLPLSHHQFALQTNENLTILKIIKIKRKESAKNDQLVTGIYATTTSLEDIIVNHKYAVPVPLVDFVDSGKFFNPFNTQYRRAGGAILTRFSNFFLESTPGLGQTTRHIRGLVGLDPKEQKLYWLNSDLFNLH